LIQNTTPKNSKKNSLKELLLHLSLRGAIATKQSLDDLLDGILIKSENWQALNLILGKYKEKVQTIYIDPPFKTGQDFLYKDKYQDSSWITLMGNRLNVATHFLNNRGNIFVHLDWNANFLGRQLLGKLFPEITEIIWNTNATKDEEAGLFQYKSFGKKYVRQHDTIFQCAKTQDYKFLKLWKPNRRTTNLSIGWLDLISYPRIPNPRNLKDYEFYVEKYNHNAIFELQELQIKEKVFPIGDIWNDIYSFTQSEMRVSENVSFDTQKPENLLRRIVQSTSVKEDIVMDFFAGSGTTLAVAHKLKRKWIGVEMADFFQEFYFNKGERKVGLKGRLKIVLQGDKEFTAVNKNRRSHLSKDINWQGGGFFKYHILEQYEDTLDNIELTPNRQAELKFGDDYLLKYFLDYETRENPSLLNIDQLKNPFAYKLKVNLEEVGEPQEMVVDIPETFNYLLGLKVKKIKAREIASPSARNDKKRKYLFILGEKEGKDIAIGWREYNDDWSGKDFKEDKEFIIKELEPWAPHIVYVNGQSVLTPKLGKHNVEIRYIEPEFKKLMES